MKKSLKKTELFKLFTLLVFFLMNSGLAFSQCGTGTSKGSISPSAVWQNTASTGSGQRPYWSFSAVAGKTYSFSNCSGVAEDTYIRIYNSAWTELANNDDNGPFGTGSQNASLVWTCTATGTYYLFLTHYSCVVLSNNQILTYKASSALVPSTGFNTLSLTSCNEGVSNIRAGGTAYPDNSDGYTVITPSSGNRVQLSGTYNTEVNYDYIYVYDGIGTGGTLLGTFTGTGTLPCNLISSAANQSLTVRFVADENTGGTGIDFIAACVTPPGDQTTAGNCSWIGYVYAKQKDFSNTNYRGYITENENFNRAFGTGAVSGATTNLICSPSDDFTIRYKMTKSFTAGTYSFTIGGDDGIRFYIDGVLKINDWTDHSYTSYTYTTSMTAGNHTLIIEYYDNNNGAQVSFSSVTANSCTWTGNVSSDWNDKNNWNPSTIAPTSTMDVFIPNTTRKPVSNVNFTIGAGRQLVISSGTTLTFDGKGLTNNGTLTINAGGNLYLSNTTAGSGFFTNAGTVNCGGSMLLTLSLVNNGIFNCTGSVEIHDNFTNTANYICSGTMTFSGGVTSGTQNSTFTNSGTFSCYDLIINKEISPSEGAYSLYLLSELSVENLTISRGVFNTKYYSGGSTAYNVNVKGNWVNNSTFIHNNKKVTFNGSSIINTGGTGTGKAFYDVDFNGVSLTLNTNDIIVSRNFNIIGGLLNTGGRNMTIGGNWTNGGTFLHGNGTVIFNGSSNTSLNGNSNSIFYNLIINKSVANKISVTTKPLYVDNNLTVSTGIFELANNDTSANSVIMGSVSISAGATFLHSRSYSGAGHESLVVFGNWDNQGTYTFSSPAMLVFNGQMPQQIRQSGSPFSNIRFNNSSAGYADLNVSLPLNINHGAIFNNGVVYFSGTGSLNFNDGATATGANDNSFVNGPVSKTGQQEFEFPIGAVVGTTNVWAPLKMADPGSTATDKFTAQYFFQAAPNNWQPYAMCNVYDMDHVSGIEYWDIIRNSGSTYPDLTLYWKKATRSDIADIANLTVGHQETCGWKRMPGVANGTLGTNGTGSVTATGFTGYSLITFGTKLNTNPLPVELVEFNGECKGDKKEIAWKTASETNNDHFTLESSIDGLTWNQITTIRGAGNSNAQISYRFEHNSTENIMYYRISQTDFNGQSETFDPIVVKCESNNEQKVIVFPNPFNSDINISLAEFNGEKVIVYIHDAYGKIVFSSEIFSAGFGNHSSSIDLSNLPAGIYFMEMRSANHTESVKIIKSK